MADPIDALHRSVEQLVAQGEFAQATALCQQILDQPDSRSLESAAHSALGRVHITSGRPDTAAEHLQQALTIARDVPDRRCEVDALTGLCDVNLYGTGDHTRSLELGQQALTIARDIHYKNGEHVALYVLGSTYVLLQQPKKARPYCEKVLEMARASDNRIAETDALNGMGLVCSGQQRYPQALRYFKEALELARAIGYHTSESVILLNMGMVQFAGIREYQQALEHYRYALERSRALGHTYGEFNALFSLGVAAYQMQDYQEAKTHFTEALAIKRQAGMTGNEERLLAWLGMIAYREKDYPQAMAYYEQVRDIYGARGDRKQARKVRRSLLYLKLLQFLTFRWLFDRQPAADS